MKELVAELLQSLAAGKPVAYCRLVETRGSTPQKPGAMMLVYEDGTQSGTLGGGCVEAEVRRSALAVLADGEAEVSKFQLDSDYGWDDGLICGGRMQILVVPLRDETNRPYFAALGELVERGDGVTEVVVFDAEASGIAAPQCYLLDDNENVLANLSGAGQSDEIPSLVREQMRPLSVRPRAYAARGIAYLPALSRCRLLIVGGGHVGQAVADLAADLDFDVWVCDDREEFISRERFPKAERHIAGQIDDVLPTLEITPDTYCLIVTRGHNHDQQALYHLAERGARYVGMIGSRRKIKLIYDNLLNEGISAESLEQVHAPLGIHIGSQTVPEIAVSICAELVSHRNRDGVVPGRPEKISLESAE